MIGESGAYEVAGGEFVAAAGCKGFGVGCIAPNLVVTLRKRIAKFSDVPTHKANA